MKPSGVAIVLMAKAPQAGRVKTRLCARLAPEQAAGLYELFLRHTSARMASIGRGPLVVCFDPPDALTQLQSITGEDATQYIPQIAGDLGARIAGAAKELAPYFDRLLFVGADSPDLPEALVHQALDALMQFPVVAGPTDDGGYWCLGVSTRIDVGALLRDIPWSSGRECVATLERADDMGLEDSVVGRWNDVDTPADLDALLWRLEHSKSPDDRRLMQEIARRMPSLVPQPTTTSLAGV